VPTTDMKRLAAYPVPTYIAGIDEPGEQGYIASAHSRCKAGFSSLCTKYPLDANVLALLWDEVAAYWASPTYPMFRSVFHDPQWGQQ
ncbi:MAG TPA: hypothetical protein V6C65_19730, partial [Allocoleopsis sp.]